MGSYHGEWPDQVVHGYGELVIEEERWITVQLKQTRAFLSIVAA